MKEQIMKSKVGSLVIMAIVTLSAFHARASEPPTAPSDQARPTISDLLRKYQEQNPKAVSPQVEERVVNFPKDRSIGHVYVVKRQPTKERLWHYVFGWVEKDLGEARGDVKVPAYVMLRLDIRGDEWRKTKPFAAIGPNDIGILNLYQCNDIDDYFMSQIRHLTGMEALFISQSTLTPRGINYIRNFRQLRALVIPDYIQSKELKQLGELTLLEYLNFGGPMVNDEKLSIIGKLTSLTQLSIGGSEVGVGLTNLKNLKSLRYLNLNALRSYNLDRDLEHIAGLTNLEELDLEDAPVNDAGLIHLQNLSKLKRLNLLKRSPSGKITGAGMVHLKNLKSLEELTIPRGASDAGLEQLAALDSLKKINLWGDDITDKSMPVLAQMKSLETLEISSRNITDAGIEKLAQCPRLKSLSLQNTPITEAALSNLSKIKTLTNLSFWDTNINGRGLSFLKELPKLTDLSFMSENFTEDSTLHLGQVKTLKVLRLQYIGFDFDDKTIANLSNLVSLKNLSFVVQSPHRFLFTDAGMAHFGKLKSLEHLYISDCSNITDEGLKHFEGLSSLKQLRLDKSKVTMAGVARLKQKIPGVIVTVPCTMQAYQTQQKTTKQKQQN
jgi:Leucine-rich repeat (LRR) protein